MSVKKLLSGVVLMVLLMLVVGVALTRAYQRTADAALMLSNKIMEDVAHSISRQTQAVFQATEAQLEIAAAIAESRSNSGQSILDTQDQWLRFFWKQVQLHEYLEGFYVGDNQGNFIQAHKEPQLATRVIRRGHGIEQAEERIVYRAADYRALAHLKGSAEFNPLVRPWYTGSGDQPVVVWSDIYRFKHSRKIGVSPARPFFDAQGRKLGVFAADITLEKLSDFLSGQSFGQFDVAVIVNGEQELIAYPLHLKLKRDMDAQVLPTLDNISEEQGWLVEAWRLHSVAPHHAGSHQHLLNFTYDRDDYASVMLRLPERFNRDWRILVAAPKSDLLGGIDRALMENLTMMVIIMLMFVLIMYFLFGGFGWRDSDKPVEPS